MAIQFRDIFQFDSIMAGNHDGSIGKKSADICSSLVLHIANSCSHTQLFFLHSLLYRRLAVTNKYVFRFSVSFMLPLILTFNFKFSLSLAFCSYIYFICFPRCIFVFSYIFLVLHQNESLTSDRFLSLI